MARLSFDRPEDALAFTRRLWEAQHKPKPGEGTTQVFPVEGASLFMPDDHVVKVRNSVDVTPFETVMSKQAAEQLLSRGTISVAQILGAR